MDAADGIDTPPPPSQIATDLINIDEDIPKNPLKRSDSLDSAAEEASHSQAEAHRAYLARSVPHVFTRNGNTSSPLYSSPASPTTPSPLHKNSSRDASTSPTESTRHSPMPLKGEGEGENDRRETRSNPASTNLKHPVVKGFRGPIPGQDDQELIAKKPPLVPVPGSSLYDTMNYPYTRNGYNYIAAGPASEYLPISIYRTIETEPRGVHWSWSDRSPFTHISDDASIICSDKGFRSARANVPIREGAWYVEMHILQPDKANNANPNMQDGPHVRLGWARREAGLNAPVGMNGYSYGLRDTGGEKIFLSRTYKYGKAFGPGDVVGMYINLPKARAVNAKDPSDPARISRKRIPIRYKSLLYFESMEYPASKEMEHLMARSRRGEKLRENQCNVEDPISPINGFLYQPQVEEASNLVAAKEKRKAGPGPAAPTQTPNSSLRPLPTLGKDSMIGFFINGEPQGIAFENLLDFRPLKRQKAKEANRASLKAATSSSLGLGEEDSNDASIITSSSSLASILKSRENHFDDGSLGYLPFVSLFGGARVKIISRADHFKFPPPKNVKEALMEADARKGKVKFDRQISEETPCRAMEERYEEYLQELWTYDLQDEVEAKKAYEIFLASQEDDDEEEEEEQKVVVKSSNKKQKKKAANDSMRSASPRVTSTPLRDVISSPVVSTKVLVGELSQQDDLELHVKQEFEVPDTMMQTEEELQHTAAQDENEMEIDEDRV